MGLRSIFGGRVLLEDGMKSANVPWFGSPYGGLGENEVTTAGVAYGTLPWFYRAAEMRAATLSRLPYRVEQVPLGRNSRAVAIPPDELADRFPALSNLRSLLYLTEAALCLVGAAYWPKLPGVLGTREYRWVSPMTVIPVFDRWRGVLGFQRFFTAQSSGVQGRYLENQASGWQTSFAQALGAPVFWQAKDVVYFWQPDPDVELGPGRSPGRVALEASGLGVYLNRTCSAFFARGAIRAMVIACQGSPTPQERAKIEGWWKSLVGGWKRAFETIALSQGMKPELVGDTMRDVMAPELAEHARRQICTAFGIPVVMMEDSANYATAMVAERAFLERTVIPQSLWIEETVNAQALAEWDLRLRFEPHKLECFRQAEMERAEALSNLTSNGLPLLMALDKLGFDLTSEERAEIEAAQSTRAAAQVGSASDLQQQAAAVQHFVQAGIPVETALGLAGFRLTPAQQADLASRLGLTPDQQAALALAGLTLTPQQRQEVLAGAGLRDLPGEVGVRAHLPGLGVPGGNGRGPLEGS